MISLDVINERISKGIANPWYEISDMIVPFMGCLVAAIYLIWAQRRFNPSPLYGRLAYVLLVLGTLLLIFGRNPHPAVPIVLLVTAAGLAAFVLTCSLLLGVLISKLPGYDVAAEQYLEGATGRLQLRVAAGLAATLLLAMWWLFPNLFYVGGLYFTSGGGFAITLLGLAASSLLAPALLPSAQEDAEGLGLSKRIRYEDLLAPTGPASRNERMAVPIITALAGSLVLILASGSFADNQNAFITITLLGAAIGYTEHKRSQRGKDA